MMSASQRLQHKTSVITGSSSGLGRAIALRYSREGSNVVCADLTPTARSGVPKEAEIETHELIKKEAGRAIFVKCDVGDAGQMEALIEAAVKEFGRIDMYVIPNTPERQSYGFKSCEQCRY
jgi:NAD(P)-dependent dehydrogenase (short-subunit alcohol dehydrogenase family)